MAVLSVPCCLSFADMTFIGKSAAQEKKPDESAKRRSKRMGSAVVRTQTTMTTTCNYNVHFHFTVSKDSSSLLYGYNVRLQASRQA